MSQDRRKQLAAEAALAYIQDDMVIGVGTGSTVNYFIDGLAARKLRIKGAVSSSEVSTALLKKHRFEVLDLNSTGELLISSRGAGRRWIADGARCSRVVDSRTRPGRRASNSPIPWNHSPTAGHRSAASHVSFRVPGS